MTTNRQRRFWQREPDKGVVTLVGAGPGGADLITVRGARALAAADVIVYDTPIDRDLLGLADVGTERIGVGTRPDLAAASINAVVIEHALAGRHVVRLMIGDPFMCGSGIDEAAELRARGIDVDVVPGVPTQHATPWLAAAPLAGRPHGAATFVA
ncbi:MAG: uroporphyrinogen-III C-methyltransferase [Ilumatobacter sp.]